MIRASAPVGAQTVNALGEEKSEEREEEAGDFEPENASGMNEGPPDGFAESLCSLFGSGNGVFAALRINGRVLADRLRGLRCAVTQHARCDSHTHAQLSTNTIRLHIKKSTAFPSDRAPFPIAAIRHQK
jgi:hypothetical protein